jgi:hypothetical protein
MTLDENQIQVQHTRKEIHEALKDSIQSFADEAGLEDISERHDALLAEKLESTLVAGRRALDVLSVFWKTPEFFSEGSEGLIPTYVWISILSVNSHGQRESYTSRIS